MREIKFRSWFTIKKVMFIPHKIINPINTEAPEQINCVILMQFTGLKDKNGVDIYGITYYVVACRSWENRITKNQ